jgi:UDP-glucose 4-epimerase
MRVVVTGVNGFIGSHVCRLLQTSGHKVIGIDDRRMGVLLAPDDVPDHNLTIGHPNHNSRIRDILIGAKAVVHCAAHADVSRNWTGGADERFRLWHNNVTATMDLLEATPSDAHMIFLSTGAVYGDSLEPAKVQEFVRQQSSPYSASKLAGEALVQAYAFAREAPWTVFRLGCAVGAGYHHGHIADFVRKAKENGGGVVHGLNDGTARRSFVHVKDVAKAITLAIASQLRGTYNLAVDEWSPRDTARIMGIQYSGPKRKHGWIGDPLAILDKASHAWWKPEHTVEQGVRDALASLGWRTA